MQNSVDRAHYSTTPTLHYSIVPACVPMPNNSLTTGDDHVTICYDHYRF